MHHIEGFDRDQLTMFPEALDEYIHPDNPVRFIDAFVGSLDHSALGFQRVIHAETGRPPYHPGDLLCLYIYGYLIRLRSSRGLEKEAKRNVELMWWVSPLISKPSLTFAGTTSKQSKRSAAPSPFSAGNAICSAENSSPSDGVCLRQVKVQMPLRKGLQALFFKQSGETQVSFTRRSMPLGQNHGTQVG